MASGKSLELAAIKRPEPVVLVPGKVTNRAWRRANGLYTRKRRG